MFGLERIGWLVFLKVILILLLVWYLLLFITYWWKKSFQPVSKSFERNLEEGHMHAELNAINSDESMPLGYVSPMQVPGIPLIAESDSDSDMEDGVALEWLTEGRGITSEAFFQQMQIIR